VLDGDDVVGHVMWGVDPEDDSHWFGGLVIDRERQGRGLGRATVGAVLALWEQEPALSGTPYTRAALSVAPANTHAIALYTALGFAETGEMSDDELVMRRPRVASGQGDG
jgi:diamine N-acetyltransferase